MKLRLSTWVATPLLSTFAVIRVAALASGSHTMSDLAVTLATIAGGAAIAAAIVHFGLVRLGSTPRTIRAVDLGVAALVAVILWGATLMSFIAGTAGVSIRIRYLILPVVCIFGFAWYRGWAFVRASRFITVASVLLVAGASAQWLFQQARATVADTRVLLPASLTPSLSITAHPLAHPSPRRDIYLLVLDARANGKVLRDIFAHDDSAFLDTLRALGFVLPEQFHSNYVRTDASLPSLLNFAYVHGDTATRPSLNFRGLRSLADRNRAAVFLKAQGYRYLFFPSEWFALTAGSSLADNSFRAIPLWRPEQLLGSQLRRGVLGGTPVMRQSWIADPTAHARASFAGLKRVPDDPRPTFVFAHILLPHPPYIFGVGCRPGFVEPAGDTALEKRLYVRQLRCTNGLVLDAVTEILSRSAVRPVIAIVGDHGSRVAPFDMEREGLGPGPALRERFGAFGAFLTPGSPGLFVGDVTLVNVMQIILTSYFGADISPARDRFFIDAPEKPYWFHEVAPAAATARDR